MDTIGRPLTEAIFDLVSADIHYVVEYSAPTRDFFAVDNDRLYVIRQLVDADGVYHLIAAAKMRKEVYGNGLQN